MYRNERIAKSTIDVEALSGICFCDLNGLIVELEAHLLHVVLIRLDHDTCQFSRFFAHLKNFKFHFGQTKSL